MYSQIFVYESNFIQNNPNRKSYSHCKQIVVCSHSGVLVNKNELSTDTCDSMMNLIAVD